MNRREKIDHYRGYRLRSTPTSHRGTRVYEVGIYDSNGLCDVAYGPTRKEAVHAAALLINDHMTGRRILNNRRFGNKSSCTAYKHAPGCRPGRPLCRRQRRVRATRRPCRCSAYPWPHRSGSGACPGHRQSRYEDMPAVLRKTVATRDEELRRKYGARSR